MTAMAGSLRLRVIAEGIETELQHARLSAMGCTHAQGQLYGRPQAPLDRALAANRSRATVVP